MNDARARILGGIRRSLRRVANDPVARGTIEARLAKPPRGPIPARAQRPHDDQVDLFVQMAEEQAATVTRVAVAAEVPAAVAAYLKDHNLPSRLKLAPDPALEALPWGDQPMLRIETGRGEGDDEVSLTGAFAGIAETGTLMLHSGPQGPSTLNFLPDTHIVVLPAARIVGSYEDAWDRVRAVCGRGHLPRTVNFITGPSRTADIEQT
ncbi:MAG: lactate utilization protein C, partial [Alphaproteobacteria bacterium]